MSVEHGMKSVTVFNRHSGHVNVGDNNIYIIQTLTVWQQSWWLQVYTCIVHLNPIQVQVPWERQAMEMFSA